MDGLTHQIGACSEVVSPPVPSEARSGFVATIKGACRKLQAPFCLCYSKATQAELSMPHLQTGFHPKFLTVWNEGYDFQKFKADIIAALTVAIVALPLSMAIAIASHVSPERGIYTSIIGGFIISALGGSRFQIGGPAGAFIVLLASVVDRFGIDGLVLATMMAGVIIFLIGAFRLGVVIRYVPHPVTLGFTAGIAVIIFASQIKELLGLQLQGQEPGAFLPKLQSLWQALPSLNVYAVSIALLTILVITLLRRYRPTWPGFLLAVFLASVIATFFSGHVDTIASRFGGIPSSLPNPHLPQFEFQRLVQLLPSALSLALLGSIESLLSAVVADGMSGRFHRSNTELMAQGLANIASAMFGGIVATGTIARTATNIRAGAKSPVSGMLHAVFLLLFIVVAAPLAGFIPLAALAGILAVVCWNMVDKVEIAQLLQASIVGVVVIVATFLLTILVDLTSGILAGVFLSFVLAPQAFLNGPRTNKQP